MIEKFENTCGGLTMVEWVHQMSIGREYEKHLINSKTGWRNDHNKKNMFEKAASDRCKNMRHSTCGNKHKKSPYHKFEGELYKLVLQHRKKAVRCQRSL